MAANYTRPYVAIFVPLVVIIMHMASAPVIAKSNLLENGSFEDGPEPGGFITLNSGSKAISGWTVTRATIDYIGTYFPSSHGNRHLDLDGSPGYGGIKQTFMTTANQKYEVTFDMAGNPGARPSVKKLKVQAAGQSTLFTHAADLQWTNCVWEFTAKDSRTTIEFFSRDNEGGFAGPLLDNTHVREALPTDFGSYADFIEEVRRLWPLKVRQWFQGWEQAQAIQ